MRGRRIISRISAFVLGSKLGGTKLTSQALGRKLPAFVEIGGSKAQSGTRLFLDKSLHNT